MGNSNDVRAGRQDLDCLKMTSLAPSFAQVPHQDEKDFSNFFFISFKGYEAASIDSNCPKQETMRIWYKRYI